MKYYIHTAACVIIIMACAFAQVYAQDAQDAPAPTLQEKRAVRVQQLMDQMPAETLEALQAGLAVIQAELDAKGSKMNARRVVMDSLENLWKVKALTQQRQQMLGAEIAVDGDPLIEALEDKIIAIDATKTPDFKR